MKKEYVLLIAGTLGIAVATFISLQIESIWIGYYLSFSIGVICLFLLYRWAAPQFTSKSYKKTVGILLAVMVLLQSMSLVNAHWHSARQSKTLSEIGTSIDQVQSQIEIEQDLIKALQHYHHKADESNRSIIASYKLIMGDKLSEDGIIMPEDTEIDRISYQAEFPDSETVIIKIASNVSKGENPDFININNKTGRYQASISLTSEGVNYVREN